MSLRVFVKEKGRLCGWRVGKEGREREVGLENELGYVMWSLLGPG